MLRLRPFRCITPHHQRLSDLLTSHRPHLTSVALMIHGSVDGMWGNFSLHVPDYRFSSAAGSKAALAKGGTSHSSLHGSRHPRSNKLNYNTPGVVPGFSATPHYYLRWRNLLKSGTASEWQGPLNVSSKMEVLASNPILPRAWGYQSIARPQEGHSERYRPRIPIRRTAGGRDGGLLAWKHSPVYDNRARRRRVSLRRKRYCHFSNGDGPMGRVENREV